MESNRRRTGSPQDDELDSAGSDGELAGRRRSLKLIAVPETAKPVASTASLDWGWLDRTIWTDRMLAALENGVRGSRWYSLMDKVYRPHTLASAWEHVRGRRGAAGIDGQSIARFEAQAERYLSELLQALQTGRYRASPVRRVEIAKGDGKTRPLGIPRVKDRIVQVAVKRVIEPIFEQAFMPRSYGFRPGRGCKDALREVDALLRQGHTHVVDADLKGYFDSIPHERLEARIRSRIRERISDDPVPAVLADWRIGCVRTWSMRCRDGRRRGARRKAR